MSTTDDLRELLARMRRASAFVDPPGAVVPLITAVEAVLELHYPEPYAQGPDYCAECEHRYPCATVTAIHAALIGGDDD